MEKNITNQIYIFIRNYLGVLIMEIQVHKWSEARIESLQCQGGHLHWAWSGKNQTGCQHDSRQWSPSNSKI